MQLAYDLAQARRQEATMNVRPVAQRLSPATGRERVRKQALRELAAAREQQRLERRLIAMVAAGEMTAAKAAQLLDVDSGTISELVEQAKTSRSAPPPRPRPSTPTR
jgi:hypothetical protein